jgi:hypothetical protein
VGRPPGIRSDELVGENQSEVRSELGIMWLVGTSLLVIWFILTFVLHKGGFVHALLLGGFSVLVVQFVAYRKTKYQRDSSRGGGSV